MLSTGFIDTDTQAFIKRATDSLGTMKKSEQMKCLDIEIPTIPLINDATLYVYIVNSSNAAVTAQYKTENITSPNHATFCIPNFDDKMRIVFQIFTVVDHKTMLSKMTHCGISDVKTGEIELLPVDLSKLKVFNGIDDIIETHNNKKQSIKIQITVNDIEYDMQRDDNYVQQYQYLQPFRTTKSSFSFFPRYFNNLNKISSKKELQVRAYLIDRTSEVKKYEDMKPFYNNITQNNQNMFAEEIIEIHEDFDCNILVVVGNQPVAFGTFSLGNISSTTIEINMIKASKALKLTVEDLESASSETTLNASVTILSSVYKTSKIRAILSKKDEKSLMQVNQLSNAESIRYLPDFIQHLGLEEMAPICNNKLFQNTFGENILVRELIARNIKATNEMMKRIQKPPSFIIKLWFNGKTTIEKEDIEVMKSIINASEECAKNLGLTLSTNISCLTTEIIDEIFVSAQQVAKAGFVTSLLTSNNSLVPSLIEKHFPDIAKATINAFIRSMNSIPLNSYIPLAISIFSMPTLIMKEIGTKLLFIIFAAFQVPINIQKLTRKELFGSILWAETALESKENEKYVLNIIVSIINYSLTIDDPLAYIVIDKGITLITKLPFMEKKKQIINVLFESSYNSCSLLNLTAQVLIEDSKETEKYAKILSSLISKTKNNDFIRFIASFREATSNKISFEKLTLICKSMKAELSYNYYDMIINTLLC